MIHRFLIYDRKFNCRLDRRYPLNQFSSFNRAHINKQPILIKVNDSQEITNNDENIPPPQPAAQDTWNTLVIKSDSEEDDEDDGSDRESDFPVSQLGRMDLNNAGRGGEIVEHSQQLILGMTHSLKNMFLKLSPSVVNNDTKTSIINIEGYSFSLKTSKYRLFYFESFTGWKLVMITDCSGPSNSTLNIPHLGPVTPESALKVFYTNILLKVLLTYPLGTILTDQKSSQNERIRVENDFLHRAGFLVKMDEFIQSVDTIF